MEADIACHLLAPRGQPQPGAVHQEVTMAGTLLTIRLTAEDIDQLRLSISSCLQELFLLIQNMWHTMPHFFLLNPNKRDVTADPPPCPSLYLVSGVGKVTSESPQLSWA
ncbi:hypothetical protein QTO34_000167 [Cnephaeus nilssonii]|uniref:Uncharacterized protein n=1 Tax=Cnephaeus nilssonii TaxID=3371016 RepID=A0AA40IAX5_CNENI|nr:hypothetical protein QTO34_000167 [Eptesicus nilssonii]